MGCYLLALLVLVSAISNRNYALIGRAAGATALGLSLAAFYIVPATYEQRWVEITRAIAPGMRVEDSFLFGHIGDPFHDKVLHTASWIAIVMLFIAVSAAALPQRDRPPNPLRAPLIATLIAVCFLLFPFSDVLWQHTPELKFLQFPWRWLLVLGLVMAALIGFNLRGSFLEAKTRRSIVIRSTCMILLAVGMTSVAAFKFWQVCDEEDNIAAQRATYRENGFEGSDEYTPTNVDNGDIQQDLPPIRVLKSPGADQADSSLAENPEWAGSSPDAQNATTKIRRWKPENKEVEIETQSPAYAVFRLMDYPAWRVIVNHVLVPARPRRDDGLLTVPLASGRSLISIRYMPREDMKLGYVISLLTLCITIGIYAKTKRPRNSQLS